MSSAASTRSDELARPALGHLVLQRSQEQPRRVQRLVQVVARSRQEPGLADVGLLRLRLGPEQRRLRLAALRDLVHQALGQPGQLRRALRDPALERDRRLEQGEGVAAVRVHVPLDAIHQHLIDLAELAQLVSEHLRRSLVLRQGRAHAAASPMATAVNV